MSEKQHILFKDDGINEALMEVLPSLLWLEIIRSLRTEEDGAVETGWSKTVRGKESIISSFSCVEDLLQINDLDF